LIDSIKAAAKTLAGGIMAAYDQYQGPGGVPGLWESNESDNGYFWWNYGMAWNAIIEYSHLTGDHQYDELIRAGLVHQIGDLDAFMPANQTKTLGNDDQGTWALAALTSAEFGLEDPKDIELLQLAKNVFDVQVQRWNEESCAGGLKWQIFTFNNGYNYRNTMSNGIFFLLAARLAQATKNETYSEWAEKSFDWAQQVGLVSEDYAVYDGTDDRTNCSEINHLQWSANHGIYTDASAIMFNLVGRSYS
jgi:mannan endo-1,6-alpha-mannosidase